MGQSSRSQDEIIATAMVPQGESVRCWRPLANKIKRRRKCALTKHCAKVVGGLVFGIYLFGGTIWAAFVYHIRDIICDITKSYMCGFQFLICTQGIKWTIYVLQNDFIDF